MECVSRLCLCVPDIGVTVSEHVYIFVSLLGTKDSESCAPPPSSSCFPLMRGSPVGLGGF